jgi:Transposase
VEGAARVHGPGRIALLERADHLRTKAVAPVREVRAELPSEPVPYEIRGRHLRVNPRLLSYWIPFVAGVGLMIGGMKTAGVPFVGIPQLVLGIALIAFASWDFVADSGRLDVASSPQAPAPPPPPPATAGAPHRRRGAYEEKFRRHAVHMVRSTGEPIAAIARELDVNPSTLAGWVRKDRIERAKLGLDEPASD